MYCKYRHGPGLFLRLIRINSSKVYCKLSAGVDEKDVFKVLIVEKCIVNFKLIEGIFLFEVVLIVAKCIVNNFKLYFSTHYYPY